MKHIHEHESGVFLEIDYGIVSQEFVFNSIHVLDENYKIVGPDLCAFLHSLFLMVQEHPAIGERFLSTIITEIENGDHPLRTGR